MNYTAENQLGEMLKELRSRNKAKAILLLGGYVLILLFLLVGNCLTLLVMLLKGHSQLWDRGDLDTTFASLKSVYLNLKSNLRVR